MKEVVERLAEPSVTGDLYVALAETYLNDLSQEIYRLRLPKII